MRDKIKAAQDGHAAWKVRLKTAVTNGGAELDEPTVRVDDRCDFGKWLHGPSISNNERSGEHYQSVLKLHAAFHQAAADVVASVKRGDRAGAENLMKMGGNFSRASAQLDAALTRWLAAS